jgi:hypothetical protein
VEPAWHYDGFDTGLENGGKMDHWRAPFNYWLPEAPNDYFRWTKFAIEKLGKQCGLEMVARFSCGGSREVLADIALKTLSSRLPKLCRRLTKPCTLLGSSRWTGQMMDRLH